MNTKIIKIGLIAAAGIAITGAIIWGVGHMKNTRVNAGDDPNTLEQNKTITDNDDPDNDNSGNGKLISEGNAIKTGASIDAAENDSADSADAADETRAWTVDLKAQVEAILDTLSFEPGITEGAAYQFTRDAENTDIGMDFSLEDISPFGATFVYTFYEGIPAESRHIIYGDEYTIEKLNGTDWTAVLPVIDNLGFNDIAHLCINMDTFKDPIDWEYAFGKLEKGTYRIKKTFWYDGDAGNRKSCDVYAQFVIG